MKALSQFLAQKKLKSPQKSGDLDEKTILYITGKVIAEEYGKRGAENVIPKRYKDKKLSIKASGSVWANEILLEKERLREILNKKLGSGVIHEIRVQNR